MENRVPKDYAKITREGKGGRLVNDYVMSKNLITRAFPTEFVKKKNINQIAGVVALQYV